MEFKKVLEGRRSIRKYKDTPVTDRQIMELMEAAAYAPSWANTQVSRFYIAKGEEKKELMAALPDFNKSRTADADVLIVSTVIKGRAGYNDEGEAFTHLGEGFSYFDNGIRVQNICLAAYDMGLGTLILGKYDPDFVREYFNIPDYEEVVCMLAVGVPDSDPKKPAGLTGKDIFRVKE